MSVTAADVRLIAPELRDVNAITDSELNAAIADSVLELSIAQWGTMFDVATKWLAAHKVAVQHPELSQQPGVKVRLYETPGAENAGALAASRFGMELARLQRRMGFGLQVT